MASFASRRLLIATTACVLGTATPWAAAQAVLPPLITDGGAAPTQTAAGVTSSEPVISVPATSDLIPPVVSDNAPTSGAAPQERDNMGLPMPSVEIFSVQVPGVMKPTASLYPQGGVVGVATGASLAKELNDDPRTAEQWHLVELYDSSCPHCRYATSEVERVAKAFHHATLLQLSTLNCNVDENVEACIDLEILAGGNDYPMFLLCAPAGLESASIQVEVTPAAVQPAGYDLAQEEAARLREFKSCHRTFNMESLEDLRTHGHPVLSAKALAAWVTGHTGVMPTHPEAIEENHVSVDFGKVNPSAPPHEPGWPATLSVTPEQRWEDALHGFTRLLYRGYRPFRHHIAVSSIRFLARTFPAHGEALDTFATTLEQAGPQHDRAGVKQLLLDFTRWQHLPDPTKDQEIYTTCKQSAMCALWTLLHVVVAATAARGLSGHLINDASVGDKVPSLTRPAPQETMDFVRDLVLGFLTCRRCKHHFLAEFDHCAYGRCNVGYDFMALPLWLWRTHNAISLRVGARHQLALDRRWPTYDSCPECWRQAPVGVERRASSSRQLFLGSRPFELWGVEELDAPFKTDKVFWFLLRTYIGEDHLPFQKGQIDFVHKTLRPAPVPRPSADTGGFGVHENGGSGSSFGARPDIGSGIPPAATTALPQGVAVVARPVDSTEGEEDSADRRAKFFMMGLATLTGAGFFYVVASGPDSPARQVIDSIRYPSGVEPGLRHPEQAMASSEQQRMRQIEEEDEDEDAQAE